MQLIAKREFGRLLAAGFLAANAAVAAPAGVILVTADRVARPIESIPASVEVLERDRIEQVGVLSADSLFRGLAGVDLQGSGLPGQMTRLNLRGLTSGYQSQRVLVLVDGRRVNDPYQGNVEFSLLPVSGLERVELVRGPASATYGSNAEGGVIQFFTRRAEPDRPYAFLSAAAGEHRTQEYRLEQGAAAGRWDYGLALGYHRTDGYLETESGQPQDWEAAFGDVQAGLSLGDAGAIRLFSGLYAGQGRDASSDRQSDRNYQAAEYRLKGGSEASMTARLWRNAQRDVYDWFYPGKGRYDLLGLGGEVSGSRWVTAWSQVSVGVEWRRDEVSIDEVADVIDRHSDNAALFVQEAIEAGDWRFSLGLRFDHAEDYGGFWSPRLGVVWQARDGLELFASLHQAHMAPSLSDRYVKVVYQGMAFIGNPDLDPETVTAYEAGLRARLAEAVTVQVTAYYQDLRDAFDFVMTGPGEFRNDNATRSTVYGGEGELRWRLPGGFSTFAALSWTEGAYDRFWIPGVDGNRIPFLAPWKGSAGLEYRTAAGSVHGLDLRYADARYADAQNQVRIDAALVADWRSRVRLHDRLYATLRVRNLFDERYEELPGVPQPGRWMMVGLEVPFR